MLRHLKYLLVLLLWVPKAADAQEKFPVTVSSVVTPPYSPYLNDYIAPGSNQLNCTFVFNDFREPSWQVRLKLRIESTSLRLETRPEYVPPQPIVVTPGVSMSLSGVDLSSYFDFKNLIILGASSDALLQNGRLPEGFYSFCFEVLDYPSGKVLSNTSCSNVWIRLNDPPRIISPQCGAFIDPSLPLNIPFQWQLANTISPNATQGTNFRLVVYEVTDPAANPFTAINSGKVLKILETDPQNQFSFNYTISSPALDIGKTYVYQIKATDSGGKDLFKNNGLSEICWFHYGYPEGAKIDLISPETERSFKKNDRPYFRWSAPDRRIRNQPFEYELRIVELKEGQTATEAIVNNDPWLVERTPRTLSDRGLDRTLPKNLKSATDYVWQITCFSGSQTVASSEARVFYGPPLIDWFFAGNHRVVVTSSTSKDSLNFSGRGKFKVSKAKDSVEVEFSSLKLKRIASYWVLVEGELRKDLPNSEPIIISPKMEENGAANFYPRTFKLNAKELSIEGELEWPLPFPTKSGELAKVNSDRVWFNYDQYQPLGAAPISATNQFTLLDPYDFELKFNGTSDFLLSTGSYELRAEGDVVLPEKVKGKQSGKVNVHFAGASQLFYLDGLVEPFEKDIAPIGNTRIYIHPRLATVDLSEETSPGNKQGDPFWKGVYIREFEIQYGSFTDKFSQLRLGADFSKQLVGQEALNANLWIDGAGINVSVMQQFSDTKVVFNDFSGELKLFELSIARNQVSAGKLEGGILLPVFSESNLFDFTVPISDEGLRPGYLKNFDNSTYTFNRDAGEQEVTITIKRGVFVEQRLIDMTIDIEWPKVNAKALAVTGFKVWGNYQIGFHTPNGTRALDRQIETSINGYPYTIDAVAAGSGGGMYSFAMSGKAMLGDDVSGEKGPPTVNIYSIVASKHLPKTEPQPVGVASSVSSSESIKTVEAEYNQVSGNITRQLEVDENSIKRDARDALSNLTSRQTTVASFDQATEGIAVSVAGGDPISPEPGGLLSRLTPRQRDIVKEVIEKVIAELTRPLTDSINLVAKNVNDRITNEVNEIIALANAQVDDKVSTLVNSIAQGIVNSASNGKVDLSSQIEQLASITTQSVTREVKLSVTTAIKKNIETPFTSLVQNGIADRVNLFVRESATQTVIFSLEGKLRLEDIPNSLLQGVDTVLRNIGQTVYDQINFSTITTMAYNTVDEAIRGINVDRIVAEIKSGATSMAVNTLTDMANEKVATAARDYLNNQLGVDVPINFTGLGKKLLSGEKLLSLDSINVRLKTKVLELNGFVYFKRDQPTYGDVFMGDINVLIKVPKPFSLKAIYLNGRVDDYSYWFTQVSPSQGETTKLGEVIPKKARPLTTPINMGVAKIVGVSGRVYHRMLDLPDRPIVPDPSNDYGAYLNLIFFDNNRNGKTMRLNVAGAFDTKTNGDYVLEFEGDIQLMSKSPTVEDIDPAAAARGEFRFSYNSAEQHFLGYGRVEVEKPGKLCASGSVLVDTKPGRWRVEIGNRDDRITFIPFCAGWSPTGWLAVTESEAELGLGVQYSVYAETPTINFVIVKANVALDAGLAFGVVAGVRYDPDFALLRAGVWVDLWADILINYKKPLGSWKSFSVLSLYAKGDLLLIFEPKPTTLEGSLKGHVRLLSIVTINFDAGFRKEIS